MKNNFLHSFIAGMFVLGSFSGSLAEETADQETVKLDDIVVTSTKVKKELMEVPAAISVITAEDIQERGHNTLVNFLKTVPGLHVSINGGGSSFYVRGQQVAGGEGVMIYIDGRKAIYSGNSGSGITQGHKLDDLPIEMIESIEVVKAPAASIYGGGAAHGIIHIHTKKNNKEDAATKGSVSASYGSWQTAKANMTLTGAVKKISYSANFTAENADGFRDTDKETYQGEVSAGFDLNENNHLNITAGANKTERKYPANFKIESDLKANRESARIRIPAQRGYGPRPGTPPGWQYPTEADSSLLYGGLDYQGRISGIQISSALNLTRLEEDYLEPGTVYDNGTFGRDETDDRSNDIIQYTLRMKKELLNQGKYQDTVTAGVDYEYYEYDNVNNLSRGTTVNTSTKRYGIFVNNDFSYDKFSLLTGIRFDKMDWDLKNGYSDNYGGKHEKTSWDIAPSYHFNKNMKIFYSLSQSYWFPNAFHLSMPSWFKGSTGAATPEGQVPEKNLTHELGIKHLLSSYLNYSITLYHTATENKYMATYDGGPRAKFGGFTGYKPVGNAISKGVELAIDGSISDWLTYRAGITWTDATWDDGTLTGPGGRSDISGKQLLDVPTWEYSAGITILPMKNVSWAVDMNYEKDSYANESNTRKNPSSFTVDTKLQYTPLKNLSLYILCTNLFNKEYDKVYYSGMTGRSYDPRPGRYLEAGITWRF